MIVLLVRLGSLGVKEVNVIAGSFKGHILESIEDYEDQHGGYGFGFRNKQWERILKFCPAMNIKVGNTPFSKMENQLVLYESGSSESDVDYCLVGRDQRKFVKDSKFSPSEECITHKPLSLSLR